MKNAGLFSNLVGLIVGGSSEMRDHPADFGATAFEIIQSHVKDEQYPVCYDFPISHSLENYPIIEGAMYHLAVGANQVDLTVRFQYLSLKAR
jgi:muramoyltetrapeptide carboxypeptidase